MAIEPKTAKRQARVFDQRPKQEYALFMHLYNWCESVNEIGDLENYLLAGHYLNREQLLQLIPFLRRKHHQDLTGLVSKEAFNSRLFAVNQFLEWAIDPFNHGGRELLDDDARELEVLKMTRLFGNQRLPLGFFHRLEPLTDHEIQLIRQAIAPDKSGQFPPGIFAEGTCHRNWTMFESGLNLGARKGELLTLKVKHLPKNEEDARIFVPRQQDDREDPRIRCRPRGKTNERLVPLLDKAVLPAILKYRDAPPPIGRNDPSIITPYLFVTEEGRPISKSTADYIIKQIGKYALRQLNCDPAIDEHTRAQLTESLLKLSWHRLRHTWAERVALELYRRHGEGAWAFLKEWGGWNDGSSMEHYSQNARQIISNHAARQYFSSYASGRNGR